MEWPGHLWVWIPAAGATAWVLGDLESIKNDAVWVALNPLVSIILPESRVLNWVL